eukprot:7821388-Ditylum_brightwellii.AAC.1
MLMDVFKEDKPGNATLDHLNKVCMYLGATTLADICDNDGKKILAKAVTGKERFYPITLWPNQEKPSGYSWQIWRRYLRKHFAKSTPRNTRLNMDWTMDKDLGLCTTNTPSISQEAYLVKVQYA